MRRNKIVPKTDLDKLSKEVLARGCDAALPRNLPDRWLRALSRDIVRAQKAELEGRGDDTSVDISGPLLVVAALVASKRHENLQETNLSPAELTDGLNKFGRAIAEEIIGRETGVFLRQYSLQNIV